MRWRCWLEEAKEAVIAYVGVADEDCPLFRNSYHRILRKMNRTDHMEDPALEQEVVAVAAGTTCRVHLYY